MSVGYLNGSREGGRTQEFHLMMYMFRLTHAPANSEGSMLKTEGADLDRKATIQ
jgi:hypothetical protein